MNRQKRSELTKEQKKRAEEAKRNLEQMMKKISPFLSERKVIRVSTAGKWCNSSCCLAGEKQKAP